ncbi:MAG: Tim44-like domain-containing protein, partial [Elusimicrobiota bacterium]
SYYSSSHYGSSRTTSPYEVYFWGAAALIIMIVRLYQGFTGGGGSYNNSSNSSYSSSYDGGSSLFSAGGAQPHSLPAQSPKAKAAATLALLETLYAQDAAMDPAALKQTAIDIFNKLQACWEARQYEPMRSLLTPYLYASHMTQIQNMVSRGEINVMENLQVLSVDLIFVNYTKAANDRLFTALITASARDYYVDDRDKKFLRGDSSPRQFREFWTFHRNDGNWLLGVIEQPEESDTLERENFIEPGAGAAPGSPLGAAAPALALAAQIPLPAAAVFGAAAADVPAAAAESPREERQKMEIAATLIFTNVYAAWENGEVPDLPGNDIFPEMLVELKRMMETVRTQSLAFRFKDFRVRKAEVVLVSGPAEFTARITAIAQKTLMHEGKVVHQETYAAPFSEYWVFGRQDGRWKLKELLPKADGGKVLLEDEQETDSSPVQIEWYYRKQA